MSILAQLKFNSIGPISQCAKYSLISSLHWWMILQFKIHKVTLALDQMRCHSRIKNSGKGVWSCQDGDFINIKDILDESTRKFLTMICLIWGCIKDRQGCMCSRCECGRWGDHWRCHFCLLSLAFATSLGWCTVLHPTLWPAAVIFIIWFSSQFTNTDIVSTVGAIEIISVNANTNGGICFSCSPFDWHGWSSIFRTQACQLTISH